MLIRMADPAQGSQLRARLSALRERLGGHNTAMESAGLAELVALLDHLLERVEVERRVTAEQLERYSLEQGRLEERLSRIENSFLFRSLRTAGFTLRSYKLRLGQILLKSPLHRVYRKLAPDRPDPVYQQWIARREAQTPSWEWHRQQAQTWGRQPLISIVMASHNPRREWLEAAVQSVLAQSYPFWELCICDSGSPAWVVEYLDGQAADDPRVRYRISTEPLGISGALNQACRLASGEYLGFLDHDDVLAPFALHYIAECLQDGPADAIYTDEDYLGAQGRRTRPSLKPAWSPDLLLDCMYWGHFLVVARDRWEELGGFRGEYDGAQDYDLALRLTDHDTVVRHVPRVLYHWRQHPGSTAASASAKPYTHDAGRGALQDAVRRRRWAADVVDGSEPNAYWLRWKVAARPRVSFILCSRNSKLLAHCLRSLDPTRGTHDCQVVVVHHQTGAGDGMEDVLREYHCDVVPFRQEFNFASMNNLGVAAATGDVLVFLNDDVTPLTPEWLELLLGHLQRPEVGVAGAKLVYPSGAIQHAGIVLG
ncbi:MAG: glycosyltransferase, partial [Bryobacteraceae bacterium]